MFTLLNDRKTRLLSILNSLTVLFGFIFGWFVFGIILKLVWRLFMLGWDLV
jgi:hypothetical protein